MPLWMAPLSAYTADLCVSWGSRVSGQDHLMVKAKEPLSFIADLITIESGMRSWTKPSSWLRSRAQLSLVVFLKNTLAWKSICQIYFCILIYHTTATKKSPRQIHTPITCISHSVWSNLYFLVLISVCYTISTCSFLHIFYRKDLYMRENMYFIFFLRLYDLN